MTSAAKRLLTRMMRVCAALAIFLQGCASLDSKHEIAQAESLVEERAGAEADWTLPWNAPPAWNGEQDLTVEQAVQMALQNNRPLRRKVEAIVAARADYAQAHLIPNPIVSVMAGVPVDGMGGSPFRVGAMEQLTWLWRRPVEIDSATAALRRQILETSDMALRLVSRVRTAHTRVALAEQALVLQQENVAIIEQALALTDQLLEVGEVSQLDHNRLELDLLAARNELDNRWAALETTKRELLVELGVAEAPATWSTTGDIPPIGEQLQQLNEADVVELARDQRLDVRAAHTAVESQQHRVELAGRGRLPDLAAGAAYEENHEGREAVFPSLDITPKLFDDNSARIAREQSLLRQAEISADATLQEALGEARSAWVQLQSHREIIARLQEHVLRLAEDNLNLATEALDAGESDLTTFLDVQRQYNMTRLALVDRLDGASSAYYELQRAVGGTLDQQPAPKLSITRESTQ